MATIKCDWHDKTHNANVAMYRSPRGVVCCFSAARGVGDEPVDQWTKIHA